MNKRYFDDVWPPRHIYHGWNESSNKWCEEKWIISLNLPSLYGKESNAYHYAMLNLSHDEWFCSRCGRTNSGGKARTSLVIENDSSVTSENIKHILNNEITRQMHTMFVIISNGTVFFTLNVWEIFLISFHSNRYIFVVWKWSFIRKIRASSKSISIHLLLFFS